MNNKGFLLQNSREFGLVNIPLKKPDKNSVLVKYLYCSICGGDYSQYIGRRNKFPISLGHEFIAQIIYCGLDVKSFKKGDYVTSDFNYRCKKCDYCTSNKSHLCIKNDIQMFSNRGFYQYGVIENTYLYKIDVIKPLYVYSLVEPLSCVLHAIEKYNMDKISTILVNGVGSIGMLFSFYLSKILQKKVYVNDINIVRKQNMMKVFHCLPYSDYNNYDLIIESTNSICGLQKALEIALNGQKICIMSHLYGENTSFIYEACCKKELQVQFPLRNGEGSNMNMAIQYLNKYWDDSYNSLLSIYKFHELPRVFANKMNITYNKQIIKIQDDL